MFKVAIVGAGEVATKVHIPAWKQVKDAEIVAVVDPVYERRQAAAEECQCIGFSDIEGMLRLNGPSGKKLDIAVVATQVRQHHDITMELLKAGVNVICEKPFALSEDDAYEMVQTARQNNLLLTVPHWWVASEGFGVAHEHVQSGAIGDLYEIHGFCKGRLAPYDLREMAGHILHLMYVFAGKPVWIFSDIQESRKSAYPGDAYIIKERYPQGRDCGNGLGDDIYALYQFETGIKGILHLVTFPEECQNDYYAGVEVKGTRGRIKLFQHQAFINYAPIDTPFNINDWHLIAGSEKAPTGLETLVLQATKFAENFVEALQSTGDREAKLYVSPEAAYTAVEMTEGVYITYRNGGLCSFPLLGRNKNF